MESFNVLDRKQEITEGLLLEASAGTGKTFAMEHLVLRLLIERNPSPTIGQILVITFTRAATRELRARIRANLEKALEALHEKKSAWDYLQAVIEKGEESIYIAKRCVEEALVSFDEASIFTIHGFCHRLLTEHPFESKSPTVVNDPDSQEYLPYLRELFFDMLRKDFTFPLFSTSQVEKLLARFRGDITVLVNQLISLVQQERAIPDYATFGELAEKLNEWVVKLSLRWRPTVAKIDDDYHRLAPCYKKMGEEEFEKQVAIFAEMLEKGEATPTQFDTLLQGKEIVLDYLTEGNRKKRGELPPPEQLHYPGLIEALQTELLPLIKEAADETLLLLRAAKEGQKIWRTFFDESDHFSPDNLLKKVDAALRDQKFLEVARESYRAVLVDEFQDTDPIQWSLVKKLCGACIPLYIVGDPKQSIYAFRKSDVYTYLEATRFFPEKRRFLLTTNYRSVSPLIDVLNTLFSKATNWLTLPQNMSSLSYIPVKAAKGQEEKPFSDQKGPFHIFATTTQLGRQKSWPPKSVEETRLFPYIANEMSTLALPYDKIVVLVKDRFQGERLQTFLEKNGIPTDFQTKDGKQRGWLLETLLTIMRGVLDFEDASALKCALSTDLIGFTEKDLSDLECVVNSKLQCQTLLHVWKEKGLSAFYQALLNGDLKNEGETLRLKFLKTRGEGALLELDHFLESTIDFQRVKGFSPHQFVQALEEIKKGEEGGGLLEAQIPADCPKVNIMTLHKSKGLEFDVVFALSLASRHLAQEEIVAVKDRLVPLDESDPTVQMARQERASEKMRALYVALTRAKKRVYLPLLFDADQKEIPVSAASPCELFFSKLYPYTPALLQELQKETAITHEVIEEEVILKPNRQAPPTSTLVPPKKIKVTMTPEPIFSFSAISASKPTSAPSQLSTVTEKNRHTLPAGAETGVLIHTLFEKIFSFALFAPYQRERITALTLQEVNGTFLSGWEEVILEMVDQTLHKRLPTGFALSDVDPNRVLSEIEFLYPTQEGYLKGFIDLAFEHAGKYYLVDWKSNYLGENDAAYSPANLQKAMEEHDYPLQAAIYTEALRRYLAPYEKSPFEAIFGGALYIFLRGNQVYLKHF